MQYIEYIPGTVARITDKPTNYGHEDVNLLSRNVSKFNDFLRQNPDYYARDKETCFKQTFDQLRFS